MGLDYYGCDIDKQYVEFAKKRIKTSAIKMNLKYIKKRYGLKLDYLMDQ